MMRSTLFAVVLALPGIAAAQDTTVKTGSINRADQAGISTEHQVRQHLTKAGYIAIGTLDRDSEGAWRTTAMKGDEMMSVTVSRSGTIEDR